MRNIIEHLVIIKKLPSFIKKILISIIKILIKPSKPPVNFKLSNIDFIIDNLEIGDVILKRTNNCYIINNLIPGYWKHVGIYIGDNCIIHATKIGVSLEDAYQFLKCDECCILRAINEPSKSIIEAVNKANKLKGKPYDFLFDSDDDSCYYCTEVIEYCYSHCKSIKIYPSKKEYDNSIPPNDLLNCGFSVIYTTDKG